MQPGERRAPSRTARPRPGRCGSRPRSRRGTPAARSCRPRPRRADTSTELRPDRTRLQLPVAAAHTPPARPRTDRHQRRLLRSRPDGIRGPSGAARGSYRGSRQASASKWVSASCACVAFASSVSWLRSARRSTAHPDRPITGRGSSRASRSRVAHSIETDTVSGAGRPRRCRSRARPTQTRHDLAATSSAAIGWMQRGRQTDRRHPTVAAAAMRSMNSKNCVAWTIE